MIDNTPIWVNNTHTFAGTTQEYTIKDSLGNIIFQGNAVRKPGETAPTINLNRIVEDYLNYTMTFNGYSAEDPFFDFHQHWWTENNSTAKFILEWTPADGTPQTKEFYTQWDWSFDPTSDWIYEAADLMCLSYPINGHANKRQILPFTFYSQDPNKTIELTFGSIGSTSSQFYHRTTTKENAFTDTLLLCSEYCEDDINQVFYSSTNNQYDFGYCGDYAVVYRNATGGMDAFLFEGNGVKTCNFERSTYRQDFNPRNREELGKTINTVRQVNTWKISTGWLTELESEKFASQLATSSLIYLQDLSKDISITGPAYQNMIPVVITDTSVEVQRFKNGRKLNRYTLNFEESQDKVYK